MSGGRRRAGMGVLVAGLALAGCQFWPFVLDDEKVQLLYVRSFKQSFTPSYNKTLGVALRELGYLISYGIPTKYGIDLSSYLSVLPGISWPRGPVQPLIQKTSANELTAIYAQGGTLQINALAAMQGTTNSTFVYTLDAVRTPTGTTGKLTVTTSGTNWQMVTGAGAGANTFVMNQGKFPLVPQSITAVAALTLPQGMGPLNLRMDLGSFQQAPNSSAQLPQSARFVFQTSNISGDFSGQFSDASTAVLNGSLDLKDKSTAETWTGQATLKSGDAQLVLTNDERKLRMELNLGSSVTGTVRALESRQLALAGFESSADGSAVVIRYADGTQENWNFTIPTN